MGGKADRRYIEETGKPEQGCFGAGLPRYVHARGATRVRGKIYALYYAWLLTHFVPHFCFWSNSGFVSRCLTFGRDEWRSLGIAGLFSVVCIVFTKQFCIVDKFHKTKKKKKGEFLLHAFFFGRSNFCPAVLESTWHHKQWATIALWQVAKQQAAASGHTRTS